MNVKFMYPLDTIPTKFFPKCTTVSTQFKGSWYGLRIAYRVPFQKEECSAIATTWFQFHVSELCLSSSQRSQYIPSAEYVSSGGCGALLTG